MGKNKKKQWLLLLGLLLLTATACLCYCAYQGATRLSVMRYTLETPLTQSVRIVHLTDLHSRVYGENNGDLTALVAEQKPDLILMTGDMLSREDENARVVCDLIQELTATAPVYYGFGNHEKQWQSRTNEDLTPALEAAGATVLDCTYTDIAVNGQALRLGGYAGYYRQAGMMEPDPEKQMLHRRFFDDFEQTHRYKILLGHIPTPWLDWGYIDQYPVDLVLSGHYHGGQVRLPLIGGLAAPYVGLFPEYTQGLFVGERAACVLSTGVGTEAWLPRINNLPQIVTVDLLPAA